MTGFFTSTFLMLPPSPVTAPSATLSVWTPVLGTALLAIVGPVLLFFLLKRERLRQLDQKEELDTATILQGLVELYQKEVVQATERARTTQLALDSMTEKYYESLRDGSKNERASAETINKMEAEFSKVCGEMLLKDRQTARLLYELDIVRVKLEQLRTPETHKKEIAAHVLRKGPR